MKRDILNPWSAQKSNELYGVSEWGNGYFAISSTGELVVQTVIDGQLTQVSLMEVIRGIEARGLSMPAMLRIENLLDSQVTHLNESFRRSIATFGYRNRYQGVYPIKVNQQQQVVEEVTRFGRRYQHGLEAGSKPELLAALAMLEEPESLLICNGYKDREFIELGLRAVQMGRLCFFVIETPGELDLLIEQSRTLGIRPRLGLRLKLSNQAGGHWNDSGGDRSIFGLTSNECIELVDRLRAEDMLDCLQLLHAHLGSQIPNIRNIRSAVTEICRYFIEFTKEQVPLTYLDLGGGLAVDYDGSKTSYTYSRNYTLDEYTADIIEVVMATLDEQQVPHPVLITESGRALVAYYSVLLFNVLEVSSFEPQPLPPQFDPDCHELIRNLYDTRHDLSVRNVQEACNDAIYYRDEARKLFSSGQLSLRMLALAETLCLHFLSDVRQLLNTMKRIPPDLDKLGNALSDIYYANFSVFQSLPDAWAIDQVFPVVPLHRLEEQPSRQCVLADITCDCDGKLDRFADVHNVKPSLPVHSLDKGQDYYLGVFLVGAYQETLGDLHNLLGDPNVVSIRLKPNNQFELVREVRGDSNADVLSYVEYNPDQLQELFRQRVELALRQGRIDVHQRREIVQLYEESMRGYTYFEK